MAQDEITRRRQQILDYLIEMTEELGYPPSMREIAKAVGLKSPSTVLFHLRVLERAGLVERTPSLNRAIRSVTGGSEPRAEANYVPILGTVPAGEPLLATENIESRVPVPEEMFPGQDLFMLRVSGDSMIEAGILDGDMVVVSQQSTAEAGEIVVALLEDEATVKHFYPRQDTIELRPANPAMEPIVSAQAEIIGKVVGVIRTIA